MAAERLKGPKQLSRYKKRKEMKAFTSFVLQTKIFFYLENASVILPILLLYCKLRFFFLKNASVILPTENIIYSYIRTVNSLLL